MQYPPPLLKLIQTLRKLPGVGTKSAERFAFDLIKWESSQLQEMAFHLAHLKENLRCCNECGCLMNEGICSFCSTSTRDKALLCIIASPRDVFAVEQTREFRGIYHVIEGLLSPIDGRGPALLKLSKLKDRISKLHIKEVVIALDSTLEGDTTALFLKRELAQSVEHISRLAFGLPMGSSLEYVDGGTLARAFIGRNRF